MPQIQSLYLMPPEIQILLAVALFLLPLFLLFLSTKRSSTSKKSHVPPSPRKLPFIGNLHQLGSLPHRSLHAFSEKLGPLMLLQLGQIPTVIVSSAEVAQEIMKTHDHIFANRPSLEASRILHYNDLDLVFAPAGEHWRQARKICVTHLLSTKMVQSFQQARKEEVSFMVDKISRAAAKAGAVNMSDVLHALVNDVVCRAVSGKFFREGGRNDLFHELIRDNTTLLGGFHVADYFPQLPWLDVFFGLTARVKKLSKRWDDLLEDILKDHADRLKNGGAKGNDFVDVLLSLQGDSKDFGTITKDLIKALLIDMFSAGTDTSYIVLEWSLAELVRNPKVMKKLQEEIRGLSSGNTMVEEDDLSKMSYLKAVVKEVLRLHPPVPLSVPRESMEDCNIKGYDIPKKTRVIVNTWAINRDTKFWEASDEFRPERFVNSPVDFKGNDFQFIPFGAGRRICPGLNFAVATVELTLANLVHKFDWELPNGMKEDDMDMTEMPGLTAPKKQELYLVPKLHS